MTDVPSGTPSPTPPAPAPTRRPVVWIVVGVVVAVLLLVGGPFLYINVIKEDAPPPLALPGSASTTASTGGASSAAEPGGSAGDTAVSGTWTATDGSQVGYRVEEVLLGQSTEGVGRTAEVEGSMTIDGTELTEVDLTVDMTTVTSDDPRRDGQFNGRIMDTATHPTATFVLTEPVDIGTVPQDGDTVTVTVTGDLTLRGVTRSVTTDLQAQLTGGTISVQGAIPITFADYEIDNPSGGPAQVGDTGTLELLVVFSAA